MSNTIFQNKFGLPISDGNEWNTGGGFPYSHAPFGGGLTPGTNFPPPFNPYIGQGYDEIYSNPILTNDMLNTLVIQDAGVDNTLQTMQAGGNTVKTGTDIINRKTFTTWAQWIEDNPVLGGALVTGGIGVALYFLIGKR